MLGREGLVQGAAAAGVGTSESSRVIIGPRFGVQPRTRADFRLTAADDGAPFFISEQSSVSSGRRNDSEPDGRPPSGSLLIELWA